MHHLIKARPIVTDSNADSRSEGEGPGSRPRRSVNSFTVALRRQTQSLYRTLSMDDTFVAKPPSEDAGGAWAPDSLDAFLAKLDEYAAKARVDRGSADGARDCSYAGCYCCAARKARESTTASRTTGWVVFLPLSLQLRLSGQHATRSSRRRSSRLFYARIDAADLRGSSAPGDHPGHSSR